MVATKQRQPLVFELVEKHELYSKTAQVRDIHWIDPDFNLPLPEGEMKRGWECKAKIRYQQSDQTCTVSKLSLRSAGGGEAIPRSRDRYGAIAPRDDRYFVEFDKPQFAIAPGQSIVFYDGDQVLGGGIIEERLK